VARHGGPPPASQRSLLSGAAVGDRAVAVARGNGGAWEARGSSLIK